MKKRSGLLLVSVVLFTLACNLGGIAPATQAGAVPAATLLATAAVVAPTSVSAPVGISISANGTSFTIPQGVASGAALKSVSISPATQDMPYWEVHPAYIQFDLGGYALQGMFHEPRIIVYPAPEYAQMSENAAASVTRLQAILANPGAPLPNELPFLPAFNAAQVFYSNAQVMKFQNGTGIRFLTQYDQAPFPVNNKELFYTFQGLTSDGAYYVAAVLPVNIAFLAQDGNPDTPLPPGGVPFDWNNFENLTAHFELVKQKLSAADPNAFTPSLTLLDTMLQSVVAGIQ
jgi:hypothetical protein